MKTLKRLYDSFLAEHLAALRQMAFVSGPRQVGKTTTCGKQAGVRLNWDNPDDRRIILAGPAALAERAGIGRLRGREPILLLDELHKYPRWKSLLKGFFDTYEEQVKVIVTGSSRLDVYRRGGDSMMGRYFIYRMHPFSVAETGRQDLPDCERILRDPAKPSEREFQALWRHGGYPEPFARRDARFSQRWKGHRYQQLLREDIRDTGGIQHLDQLEMLVALLASRSAHQLIYSSLATEIRVSVDTIRRWVTTLCSFHYGFLVKPWFRNVSRALRKEPKWFLRDWSAIEDPGARAETFIACHLLKAVEGWTDLGLGRFDLHYLRDKQKREVDFLVVRDGDPWFLVEGKKNEPKVSKELGYFQKQTKAPHAFHVVLDDKYVDADCFSRNDPVSVPARTLLSQLL